MPSSDPAGAAAGAALEGLAVAAPIRDRGVPARRAQPGRSGPSAAQTAAPTIATAMAIWSPNRTVAIGPVSEPNRHATAATTVSVQTPTMTNDHDAGASVPVPSEWKIAIGHDAYASQCRALQARKPSSGRSPLLTTSARTSWPATTPSPSQNGR